MSIWSEFKEFAVKGNAVDLAIGVVIGAAFGKIITSFVDDIIMPPIGKLTGGVDFSSLYINLSDKVYPSYVEAKKAGAAVIGYGQFLNNVINFLIVAFAIFLAVKVMNRIRRQETATPAEPPAPPEPSGEEKLLTEIRDLLAQDKS